MNVRPNKGAVYRNPKTLRSLRTESLETRFCMASDAGQVFESALDHYDLAMISYLACPESYEQAPVRTGETARDKIPLAPKTVLAPEILALESIPPTVVDIIASGSDWGTNFIEAVDGSGAGVGNQLGYSLNNGLVLPNGGIDRFYIQFSEPVLGFNGSNVLLLGSNVLDYSSLSSFSYDSVNMRGLVQLSSSVASDKLHIKLTEGITDLSLNPLDGDRDGNAGGILELRFSILVGDSNGNGSVNGGDLPLFGASVNKLAGELGYDPRADWNSDGKVSSDLDSDLSLFNSNFNQSLPTREPD